MYHIKKYKDIIIFNIMHSGLLPSIDNIVSDDIFCIKVTKQEVESVLNKSLSQYLNKVKYEIHRMNTKWEMYKKYTNPYEFIHSNLTSFSVSDLKPISRSYYKMIEMINRFSLLEKYNEREIRSFHLAEGPGGFIEAIAETRKNDKDLYYGMSLIDPTNKFVPGWDKSHNFLSKYPNVNIEKGIDGTGNLLSYDNLIHTISKYRHTMDIVTGDGGFDFSNDYNNQETQATLLLYAQIIYSIFLQKQNGSFILKVFDIFKKTTLDLVYILSLFYRKVHIHKLKTSRIANSEKYIICNGFKYESINFISDRLLSIFKVLYIIDTSVYKISSFLSCPVPLHFMKSIEYINSYYGEMQLVNINYTLSLIKNLDNKDREKERLNKLYSDNKKKCIEWCIQHNIPCKKEFTIKNIFIK